MSKEHIAEILRKLRAQSGLTAQNVGEMIGKSGKTVSAWENNHGQPDLETLIKLCDIYGVDDILAEFRDEQSENIKLTSHEKSVITAYREKPDVKPVIDKILDVVPEDNAAMQ